MTTLVVDPKTEPKIIAKIDPKEPVLHNPFYPTMKSSTPLAVSDEQKMYINEVLDIVCSDSQFKKKAIAAIGYILNAGAALMPTVTSLVPSTVVLGEPSFEIHVKGTNFALQSKILFNGIEEPTTYISSTEVSTGVNMPLWQAPAVVPIAVKNTEELISNHVDFSFTNPILMSRTVPDGSHEILKSEPVKQASIPVLKPVNEPMAAPHPVPPVKK